MEKAGLTEGVEMHIYSLEDEIELLKKNVSKLRGDIKQYTNEELKKKIGMKYSAMKVMHAIRQLAGRD